MPHGSREYVILQDYDSIEKAYFQRNSRVQWAEWHERWYNHRGKPIDHDRQRLWNMWQQNDCSAYATRLRNTRWVQTILRKMRCPPKPFDLWAAHVPESSDQSPGFHPKKPEPKKRPRPKVKLLPKCKWEAKKRAKAEAKPEESSSVHTEPGDGASSSNRAKAAEAKLQESSSSSSCAVEPNVPRPRVPRQVHTVPGDGASSSSSAAVSSVQSAVPWPCTQCKRMPWRCRCHGAEDTTAEHIGQQYELMCKRAGVWDLAQAQQGEADQKVAQLEPPEEHLPRDLWSCWKCRTMNLRHDLVCCVVGCGERRPLTQKWREGKGDWICPECQNHNWGWRRLCNWTACPSNDWRCICGNTNRSNRKFRNRFVCSRPRPFDYD